MPVYYDIFPELNLILYVCFDSVTPADFFAVGGTVEDDPRLMKGMNILIDFSSAELEVSVSDLNLAIKKYKETGQKGLGIGQTAVLSKSVALQYLGDTLTTLSFDTITNFKIFHLEQDAIRWLGLPETTALENISTARKAAHSGANRTAFP